MKAIVLMGSHARSDAGPYSDVDLVRFVEEADADLCRNCGIAWPALQPEQAPLIAETVALINATIVDAYHQET